MLSSRFKIVKLRWWQKPIPLYDKNSGSDEWRRVGWVWNQRAYLVNNMTTGWIAFVQDQVPEKIDDWFCPHCGIALWDSQKHKIEAAIKASTES